jgi:hypothetical protein
MTDPQRDDVIGDPANLAQVPDWDLVLRALGGDAAAAAEVDRREREGALWRDDVPPGDDVVFSP